MQTHVIESEPSCGHFVMSYMFTVGWRTLSLRYPRQERVALFYSTGNKHLVLYDILTSDTPTSYNKQSESKTPVHLPEILRYNTQTNLDLVLDLELVNLRLDDAMILTTDGTIYITKARPGVISCQLEIMASIPPSAFSAGRIRESQRDMKVSNTKKGNESTKFFNETFMELSPLKYNSKLMNSIWGLYNRYSPHNVKKVNDAHISNAELQQSAGSSNTKTESMISLPSAKLDNVWATINLTPSH